MRLFAKPVALALSILLWSLPVLAEIPCAGISRPAADHGAKCCKGMGMDKSEMSAPAAMALAPTPMESSAPQCNCSATREESAPVMNQEAQKLAAPVASSVDFALLLPDLAQSAPGGYRTPPLRAFSCSSQSVLCTFQI
jgi:hypothetical protein